MSQTPPEPFEPYIKAHEIIPEMTVVALILGFLQAMFFGAADAYLALKIGLTVGASIPAAVISMSILRGVLKRGSILENNLVQNMASVGESLSAGAAFTIPALFLLADDLKKQGQPAPYSLDIFQVYFVACMGGLMGILFMIPLRRYLIVKEHGKLRYPEGTACAEVLMAGDQGGKAAGTVFWGIGVAGIYRALMNGAAIGDPASGGVGLFVENVQFNIQALRTKLSFDLLPSLLAVGYILGIETCGIMISGAILGWYVIIPLISYFGHDLTMPIFPGKIPISQMEPDDIWTFYLRYIGAGAVAFGGFVSLMKSLPTIVSSISSAVGELSLKSKAQSVLRTSLEIPLPFVVGGWVVIFLLIGFMKSLNLAGFLGAALAMIFAFFFVTVSSRIVGEVGSTSMPLSGMTIGALLTTCLVIKYVGMDMYHLSPGGAMASAMVVAAMVCIAISMGGDISQDLKIGFLVGATPRAVQITQMISVLFSSMCVCKVIELLVPQVLSKQLAAPQANLIYLITKGVIENNLPWTPIFIGMFIAGCVELLGIGSLPFAVGLYLPLEVSTPILFGGLINVFFVKAFGPKHQKEIYEHGLLLCSGLVAGDALCGVFLAMLQAGNRDMGASYVANHYPFTQDPRLGCLMFALLCAFLFTRVWRFARNIASTPAPEPPEPVPTEEQNIDVR